MRKLVAFVAGSALILLSQFYVYHNSSSLADSPYRQTAANGLGKTYSTFYRNLFYFYHHLGLYPVATSKEINDYSVSGAHEFVARSGESLIMEKFYYVRNGESGKLFLFYPSLWISGTVRGATVGPAMVVLFVLSLLLLYGAFVAQGRPLLGAILTILVGLNPFQAYEVYVRDNIFSLPVTAMLLAMALCLPLLLGRRVGWFYLVGSAIVMGAGLSFLREIRTEPALVFISVAAAYFLARRTSQYRRLVPIAVLTASFLFTAYGFRQYWDHEIDQASKVVAAVGGDPLPVAIRRSHHELWHPIFCGLGDFDRKYGYAWDDNTAYDHARPILKKNYNIQFTKYEAGPQWARGRYVGNYYDARKQYPILIFDYPQYHTVIRDKVLADIGNDPLWYADILARRVYRILSETVPIRLLHGNTTLDIPVHGVIALLVGLACALRRKWFGLRLIVFSLPLSLVPLFVYSGGGTTYYAIYHIIAAAIVAEAVLKRINRIQASVAGHSPAR
jgi:hypothetical protein